MSLVERLRNQTKVLRAAEVASLLEVTPQHIYKLAASGRMPSIRVARAIRFDPQQVANWLLQSAPMYQLTVRQTFRRVAKGGPAGADLARSEQGLAFRQRGTHHPGRIRTALYWP